MNSSRLRGIVYSIACVVSLIGIAETTYLTVLYLTGETAVCGGSTGCAEVLGSNYSHLGPIPVAGFGVLAYFTAFTFATFAAFGYVRAHMFFSLTVLAMFLTTMWLLYLQAFVLHAFCRYCLFSAALILFLTAIAVITPSRSADLAAK